MEKLHRLKVKYEINKTLKICMILLKQNSPALLYSEILRCSILMLRVSRSQLNIYHLCSVYYSSPRLGRISY